MKIAFHTLGCKVNQYESEAMARMFRERGHEIVGERDFADVYVINTCTVTAVADKKSRQYIRRMKKVNPDSIVAVTGCYAQMNPETVSAIDGVDLVTGTNEKHTLPEYVEECVRAKAGQAKAEQTDDENAVDRVHVRPWKELNTYEDTGLVTSAENRTRAYIKIQEGCNRFCAYCVIPFARGTLRSRPLEEILREARQLIDAGYKELVLTGINTALYGMEQQAADTSSAADEPSGPEQQAADAPFGVEQVIAALNELPGEFRIRLSSLEPAVVNADYVKRLLKYDRLCHHLHLSAQSGSDRILQAMNRPYDRTGYLEILEAVRDFDPCYGISTDLIVGFPGEKETDFEDTLRLVEECDFCRTHVFRYSRRPKTRAASMKEQVSPQVKSRRSDALQEAGSRAGASFCGKNLGQKRRVLIEEYLPEENMLSGYTDNYIRIYVPWGEGRPDGMLDTLQWVRLTELWRDGCRGLLCSD